MWEPSLWWVLGYFKVEKVSWVVDLSVFLRSLLLTWVWVDASGPCLAFPKSVMDCNLDCNLDWNKPCSLNTSFCTKFCAEQFMLPVPVRDALLRFPTLTWDEIEVNVVNPVSSWALGLELRAFLPLRGLEFLKCWRARTVTSLTMAMVCGCWQGQSLCILQHGDSSLSASCGPPTVTCQCSPNTVNSIGYFLFLSACLPSPQPPIQTKQTQPFANTPGSWQNRTRSLGCGSVPHVRPRVCSICLGEQETSLRLWVTGYWAVGRIAPRSVVQLLMGCLDCVVSPCAFCPGCLCWGLSIVGIIFAYPKGVETKGRLVCWPWQNCHGIGRRRGSWLK
jgi:hypothetical protein